MYHSLLKTFPTFAKPSYETVVHKKVYEPKYDLCSAIPYGKRAFLWFTHFKGKDIACIIELGRTQQLQDNVHVFDDSLSYPKSFVLGTLLSGYLVENTPSQRKVSFEDEVSSGGESDDNSAIAHKFFLADDIFLFNGYEFGNPYPIPWTQKWRAFRDFFHQLGPNTITSSYSIHSIVLWKYTGSSFEYSLPEDWKTHIGYSIKSIQYRSTKEIAPHINLSSSKNVWNFSSPVIIPDDDTQSKPVSVWTQQTRAMPIWTLNLYNEVYRGKRLFWIQADLAYDVYYMYAYNKALYQYAFIPDMKTSKMMNAIFRKIPENDCLDKVEESDDEEEFENLDERKYLNTERQMVLMECVFHRKFKKWIPIQMKPEHLAKYVPRIEDLCELSTHKGSPTHKPKGSTYNNKVFRGPKPMKKQKRMYG